MGRKKANRIIAILTLLLVAHCAVDNRIAGGSSETETGTITGQVVRKDSSRVAGALVGMQSVSPSDSTSVSEVLAAGERTTTDSNGFFSFPHVSKGYYAVAAKLADTLSGLVRVNVVAGDTARAYIRLDSVGFLDLVMYPGLSKSWILYRISADTGSIGNPFDTVFTVAASPEVLRLEPRTTAAYTSYRPLDECTVMGDGHLTTGVYTLQFDTSAVCAIRFSGSFDTLAIQTLWNIGGRKVPSIKYFRAYGGPLPPAGWPQTLCQNMDQVSANIRLLKGFAANPDGTPVVGQVIQIVSSTTYNPKPVTTDRNGNFRFFVLPGTYTLTSPWSYAYQATVWFSGIRPDIATDTQVIVRAIPDTVSFTYRMYPKDTVISGTIIDTIGPACGVAPTFPLWVELTTSDSGDTQGPWPVPVSPVSDTVSGAGEFSIRVSSQFSRYRLRWGNYRPKVLVPSNPGLALRLTISGNNSISPGTTGIRLTVSGMQ
jgi:hypothetical protein